MQDKKQDECEDPVGEGDLFVHDRAGERRSYGDGDSHIEGIHFGESALAEIAQEGDNSDIAKRSDGCDTDERNPPILKHGVVHAAM